MTEAHMEPIVRQNLPFQLSVDALKKPLSIGEEFEDEFREIYDECMRIANPKYIYLTCDARQEDGTTYIGDEAFQSRVMRANFEGVGRAYPYAATCGRELYEYAMATDDPLARYWIDSISERILYQASAKCLAEIRGIAGSENVNSMNPGSLSDFPITEQKPLFRLLGDVRGLIGIELTDTCLMLPYKSLSGIYFVSGKEFVNCALCQRADCPNRRAEFDEMLYQTMFAL
jgi:hypothetical protein